jgi:hypothetical protein
MPTIQNHLRLTTVRTPDGLVEFDPRGFATVSDTQATFLLRLPGYVLAGPVRNEFPDATKIIEAPAEPEPAPEPEAPAPEPVETAPVVEPEPTLEPETPEADEVAASAPASAKKKPNRRRA